MNVMRRASHYICQIMALQKASETRLAEDLFEILLINKLGEFRTGLIGNKLLG